MHYWIAPREMQLEQQRRDRQTAEAVNNAMKRQTEAVIERKSAQ
jgi:hypothetical protein